jgi:hypothetical protein
MSIHAKAGQIYIIGCLLRPGTLTFATKLEYDYFAPDTEANDLYQIFRIQYCDMPYYILEIPSGSYGVAERLADSLNLKLVNGKPTSTDPSTPSFGLVCSATSCFTLETKSFEVFEEGSDHVWSKQLIVERENVLKMTQVDSLDHGREDH